VAEGVNCDGSLRLDGLEIGTEMYLLPDRQADRQTNNTGHTSNKPRQKPHKTQSEQHFSHTPVKQASERARERTPRKKYNRNDSNVERRT